MKYHLSLRALRNGYIIHYSYGLLYCSTVCSKSIKRNLEKPFLHILPYVDLDFDLL
jgi:hypothetical protein